MPDTAGLTERPGILSPVPGERERVEAIITTPCVQNHASFLVPTRNGDLGYVCFGGTQEEVPDISVHFSRLAPGATTWSLAVRLSNDPECSEQNPLLFPAPDGRLWLLWTAQIAGQQDTAMVRRRISSGDGRSWGPVETLFPEQPGFGTFIRHPVLISGRADWLLPV